MIAVFFYLLVYNKVASNLWESNKNIMYLVHTYSVITVYNEYLIWLFIRVPSKPDFLHTNLPTRKRRKNRWWICERKRRKAECNMCLDNEKYKKGEIKKSLSPGNLWLLLFSFFIRDLVAGYCVFLYTYEGIFLWKLLSELPVCIRGAI